MSDVLSLVLLGGALLLHRSRVQDVTELLLTLAGLFELGGFLEVGAGCKR